jgi:hypothetical protein
LGAPYFGTATTVGDFYGPVPVAWAKIAPTDNFYIQGGKLPTLIGAENAFTFQNMNIERGLLFAQEPTISRGGQLGYTRGRWRSPYRGMTVSIRIATLGSPVREPIRSTRPTA